LNIQVNSIVNIITGENGSGKSTILSELADQEYYNGQNVICISNTPLHKFRRKKSVRFNIFKQTSRTLDNSLKDIILTSQNKRNRTNKFVNALEYLNFDNIIIFEINIVPYESLLRRFESEIYNDNTNESEIYEVINYFKRIVNIENDENNRYDNFKGKSVKINIDYYFGDTWDLSIYKAPVLLILKYEKQLRKCRLISNIKTSLLRVNDYIPTSQVSSGEASYLTTLAFILSNLDENSTVIIDEPENSLHPRWQKKYTASIFDILDYYEIKLILATHSPMVVIGAVEDNKKLNLMKAKNHLVTHLDSNEINIDEVMVDVFGVLTSRSRFFSYKVNEILTKYNNATLTYEETKAELIRLKNLGPDEKQNDIISASLLILQEMKSNG
jgi:predicted ATPase